ncbi:MAG: hypothetical protein ACLPSH_12120 [Vulcanimicrobiaceae bacterium]
MLYALATIEGFTPGGIVVVMERGNLRPVRDDDPVFSIPPGFDQKQ